MTFADHISIPVGNLDNQILGAIWNALAAEAAVWSKTWREAELFVFGVGHLRNGFESFAHNAVTGRARANAAARVVNVYAMGECDIQDAARQTRMTVRDLLRVDFNGHIHRKECYREFFRGRGRRFLIDIRIRTTHKEYGIAI